MEGMEGTRRHLSLFRKRDIYFFCLRVLQLQHSVSCAGERARARLRTVIVDVLRESKQGS